MRTRLLAVALVAVVVTAAAGWIALGNPDVTEALWRYLPVGVQTRPVTYTAHALSLAETYAFASGNVKWDATRDGALGRAREGQSIEDAHAAVRMALSALGDGRSVLVPPVPAAAPRGAYGFQVLHPERIVAVVFPGSAAEAAGIRPGDIVRTVDGQAPVPSADPRARGHLTHMPTPSVSLRVGSDDGAPRDLRMSVADFQPVPASLRRLGTAIAYVELPGTAWTPEVEGRIRETASARGDAAPCGWIVDLRRNPGGSVPAIFDVLRPLLGPEPFGAFVSSTGQSTPWTRQQPDGDQAAETSVGPVAILTSRLTAGAGETAVLAFRGRPNGPTAVIGEATWGLGTGTTDFAMPDGATLQLLTRREMDRTGRLQVGPVAPDILAPTDWARFATPDDPTLSAAIQWQNDNGCRVPAR